jgi:prepilin-type N-terminal cleavage/methylation domain-containing protein
MLRRVASATTFFLQELSMKRSGFTMIELIFVIVILGILAAVAIPKLAATRDDAKISKVQSDAATLIGDLGTSYTSKGTWSNLKLSDVTNVTVTDSTGATVQPVSTPISGKTFALTDGSGANGAGTPCVTFALGTGGTANDGNVTVAPGSSTSNICVAARAKLTNMMKTTQFGGSGVVQ